MLSRAKVPIMTPRSPAADKFSARFRTPPRILTFLTGLCPAEVYARFDRDGSPNDIYNALTITLDNGALASIASTGATPLSERNYEVRVFGNKAILQLELWRGRMALIDFADKRTEFEPLAENEIYPVRRRR